MKTPGAASRTVPITGLRNHYLRIGRPGVSTRKRLEECDQLAADATPLLDEFLDAVRELEIYDNRKEGFYPRKGRLDPQDRRRDKGTTDVTECLRRGPVTVRGVDAPYEFTYLHREVNPLRTTRGKFVDGTAATRSGKGGIDYVALLAGSPPSPILGEIKFGGDKDVYYAFVQLLTYLSEISSVAQAERANKFLFEGKLVVPSRFDVHILLWDYNDRGNDKKKIIESTRRLATAFKAGLTASVGARHPLGRVLCLRPTTQEFAGSLDLVWSA